MAGGQRPPGRTSCTMKRPGNNATGWQQESKPPSFLPARQATTDWADRHGSLRCLEDCANRHGYADEALFGSGRLSFRDCAEMKPTGVWGFARKSLELTFRGTSKQKRETFSRRDISAEMPRHFTMCAVSECETAHIAWLNRPYRKARRHVSRPASGQ